MSDEQTELSPTTSTTDPVPPWEPDAADAAAEVRRVHPDPADRPLPPGAGQSEADREPEVSGTSEPQSKPSVDPAGGSSEPVVSAQPGQPVRDAVPSSSELGSGASAGSSTRPLAGAGGSEPPAPPVVGQQAGARPSPDAQTGPPVAKPSEPEPHVTSESDGPKKPPRRKRSRKKAPPAVPGEDPLDVAKDVLPAKKSAQGEVAPSISRKLKALLDIRGERDPNDPDKPPTLPAFVKSLAHGLGLLGPNAPADPLLDQQLVHDLDKLGIDGNSIRGALAKVDDADRESLRLHSLRSEFEDTLSMHRDAVTNAFVNFEYKFKSVDKLRLNLLRQAQAVFLLFDAFEKNLEGSVDSVDRQTQSLSVKVQGLDSKFQQLDQLAFDIDQRALAMRESVRRSGAEVRGAGPASQRAAFMGAVVGATAGAFFASVILFAAWVVLG